MQIHNQNAIQRDLSKRHQWTQIVAKIQNANKKDEQLLKKQQRQINKKYFQQVQKVIERNRSLKTIEMLQKRQQRQRMKRMIDDEKQHQKKIRLMRLKQQITYKKDNEQLLTRIKQQKIQHQESPFLKLIDQHQKRQNNLKNNLKIQYKINEHQQNMKKINKKQQNIKNTILSQNYNDYVENNYIQQMQQRRSFKNKYFKLKQFQKKDIISRGNELEKDYQEVVKSQIQINKKKKNGKHKQVINQELEGFRINQSDFRSSPAFIGKNPLSYQRKKQLHYLVGSINKNTLLLHDKMRVRTQINERNQDYSSNNQNRDNQHKQPLKTQNGKIYKSIQSLKKPNLGYQQSQSKNQNDNNKQQYKSRSYISYDIIQGKRKEYYL